VAFYNVSVAVASVVVFVVILSGVIIVSLGSARGWDNKLITNWLLSGWLALHIANTKVNSAFRPSGVDKLSINLSEQSSFTAVGWLCDLIWQVTLSNSVVGFHTHLWNFVVDVNGRSLGDVRKCPTTFLHTCTRRSVWSRLRWNGRTVYTMHCHDISVTRALHFSTVCLTTRSDNYATTTVLLLALLLLLLRLLLLLVRLLLIQLQGCIPFIMAPFTCSWFTDQFLALLRQFFLSKKG